MEEMRELIGEQVIKKTLEARLNPTREAGDGRSRKRSGRVSQTHTSENPTQIRTSFDGDFGG